MERLRHALKFATTNEAGWRWRVGRGTALGFAVAVTVVLSTHVAVGNAATPNAAYSSTSTQDALPLVQAAGPNLEAGGKRFVEFGCTYGFGPSEATQSHPQKDQGRSRWARRALACHGCIEAPAPCYRAALKIEIER
jgi:hypothetical protein